MAKTVVQVELTSAQEIALMSRYGRKCLPPSLVKRALAEVLRMQDDDVPLYVTVEEATSKLNADAEAERLAAEAAKPSPEVDAILFRFRAGEKFIGPGGREVTDLQPSSEHGHGPDSRCQIVAQYNGDPDSEWFPLSLDELKPAVVCICGNDGKLVSPDCPVPSHAADAAAQFQGASGLGDPEREFNG